MRGLAVALGLALAFMVSAYGRAQEADNYSRWRTAAETAGIAEALRAPGGYTVFAPTNAAFAALRPSTLDRLLKPENKLPLTKMLSYHVVPGRLDAASLRRRVAEGKGMLVLQTVEGAEITLRRRGATLTLSDETGGVAHLIGPEQPQAGFVLYGIDRVLMPR